MFYRVKAASGDAKVGDIVFSGQYDYGCSSDDTRITGLEHVSVSHSHTGRPTFTIPKRDLERLNIPQYYRVKQRDGSIWGVPVLMIALDRAKHYASEFGGDIDRSLKEDTLLQFESEKPTTRSGEPHLAYDIQDWAVGNMDWSDFNGHQFKLSEPKPLSPADFQEAWNQGPFED